MRNIDIIYIVGETRSGTTLVDRVLGSADGVTSLCEFSYVWKAGFRHNNVCSCGERFSDCGFWQAVRDRMGADDEDLRKVCLLERQVVRSRYYPQFLLGLAGADFKRVLAEYRDWMARILDALVEVTGDRIFIDSSKYPSGPLVLAGIPGVRVHVLHVVRDLRGFVHSMQKGNFNPGYGGPMAVRSPVSSSIGWVVRNLFCEMLGWRFPYQRLMYDRCVQNPRDCFTALAARIEPLRARPPQFESDKGINLPSLHTISGNPHRFSSGVTEIRVDEAWRNSLSVRDRRLTTLLGSFLLWRYGLLKAQ